MSDKAPLMEHPRPLYDWAIPILSVIFNAYAFTLQSSPGLKVLSETPPKN